MSKEVNNKENTKVNITRELIKRQVFDSSILFIVLCAIFYFVKFLNFDNYDLIIVLVTSFVIMSLLFEFSKRAVKTPVDKLISSVIEKTAQGMSEFQAKNNYQRENNSVYSVKIRSIQDLVDNLEKYSTEMSDLTTETQEKTDKSLNFTNNEYGAVKTNIEKMFSIRHKIQTIAELILELSDFVQSISSTIGLVEDIAEQTNLLALNAAVEAARAGEHGKGFAVVASEIRKLADESKQATTKIISLINDIQQTANSTVLATEEGTKEIESGLELAHIISENIEELINVMNDISRNVQNIIHSSKQINSDSSATRDYLKEISELVEESKKIVIENDSIREKLESNSDDLKQSIF